MMSIIEQFLNDDGFKDTIAKSPEFGLKIRNEENLVFVVIGPWKILKIQLIENNKLFLESPFILDRDSEFGRSVLYDSVEDALADALAMIGETIIKLGILLSSLPGANIIDFYEWSSQGSDYFLLYSDGVNGLFLTIKDCGFLLVYDCSDYNDDDKIIQIPYKVYSLQTTLSAKLSITVDWSPNNNYHPKATYVKRSNSFLK